MAFYITRLCYKYLKYFIIIALAAFLLQIIIALIFFPSDNTENITNTFKAKRHDVSYVSANKINSVLEDDEDYSRKQSVKLRLEELDFTPMCKVRNRDAISAIHRAKTQNCKKQIMNISCQIQGGTFYPHELTNSCSESISTQGTHLGCYQDEKKQRILTGLYGNHVTSNTPTACLDICMQAGFTYSGVQYGTECFCGDNEPPSSAIIDNSHCDMQCSGDNSKTCGGYFTMNVFKTGLKKFQAQIPKVTNYDHNKGVRIVFLLTLNGRALRQVNRLINVLYRTHHYFYIHVDERQSYLHRELSILEDMFPNVKMAPVRFSTIWGGASLLQMLLTSMKDIISLGWQWDFVINLSESDFPIKSLETIENFLGLNKGLNFVKSHGREVQRFIKKQGLDKTFIECENHMWRVGERKLPRGLTIDGGSDWIALSPEFVNYVIAGSDELLLGLDIIFRHTLLPAESFFHTVLRNSKYCNTYVDNNLHVTNWKRKLGCKCQYKHVVDWCGCSPNDFRLDDWSRIQNTQDKQLFFARKFEPIINQQVINKVEQWIGINDHYLISNLDSYWQSLYNSKDLTASSDDTILTHGNSIIRHNVKLLSEQDCHIQFGEISEINTYSVNDEYKGNLVAYKAIVNENTHVVIETWYKPLSKLILNEIHPVAQYIKTFRVSSDYDQKETTFRNFADILGPFSEPVLMYQLLPLNEKKLENLTLIWLDPTGTVAEVSEIHIEENNLTNHVKASLKPPLLAGAWRLALADGPRLLARTAFLVTPLEYFSGKEINQKEVSIIHTGSQSSYKNVPTIEIPGLILDKEEVLLRQNLIKSNSKRLRQDLNEWIDSLSYGFYNILNSCIKSTNNIDSVKCGKVGLKDCSLTPWSSMSPDPKGRVGKLNKETGRLERV